MDPTRPRSTLTDWMAVVGACGLGLGVVAWAAPGRAGPMLIVVAPLVGIFWGRRRGGRGVAGGAWGGSAYAAWCLLYLYSGAAGTAGAAMVASHRGLALMAATCVAFGTVMGIAAWLVAAAMGSPGGPARQPG